MRLNIQLEKKGRIAERLVKDMKWLAEEDTRGWQRTRRGWQKTRGETGRRRDKRLEENNIRLIIQLEKYFTEITVQ